MRELKILPSILSADFSRLGEEVRAVSAAGGDIVHVDVMDGHFVPNISFGPTVMKSVRNVTDKPFDVHLMIAPVDPFIPDFAAAGADMITVHAEAGPHLHRSIAHIRAQRRRVGVAINPGTSEIAIERVLDDVDLVLVMTVDPGFGGQSFLRPQLEKIRRVRDMCAGRAIDIEADGGISPETAGDAVAAGANFLVAGSSVFAGGASAFAHNIAEIRRAAESARGQIV
jgi:ribulose-phosphate 3-epimerase